jgi:hypothetical protein
MKAGGVNQTLSNPGPIEFVPDAVRKYYPILDFAPGAAKRLRKVQEKSPSDFPGAFFILTRSYFLWHLLQLALSFVLKAFSPLWHAPQALPLLMSAILNPVPFFIGNSFGWQSLHFRPLSAWTFPLKMTFPSDPPAYSTVFPEATAKTFPASVTERKRAKKHNPVRRIPSPPFVQKFFP